MKLVDPLGKMIVPDIVGVLPPALLQVNYTQEKSLAIRNARHAHERWNGNI